RHTRFSRDWSSDVCSSDLGLGIFQLGGSLIANCAVRSRVNGKQELVLFDISALLKVDLFHNPGNTGADLCIFNSFDSSRQLGERSEERRVGKECRWRWAPG